MRALDGGNRVVPRRVTVLFDDAASEVYFGGQRIVGSAEQSQVGSDVLASVGEGLQMMQLQIACLAAASAALVDIAAAPRIARKYLALDRRWDTPAALALETPRIKMINSDHLRRWIETRA